MTQNAILFDIAVAPNGQRIPLKANAQGQFLASNFPGNSWYVSEATGSDANAGNAYAPFATLDAAIAAAVANNGDVVYLRGSSHRTTTLNWNKDGVSLVGLNPGSNNNRARISPLTVANGLTQTQVTALHPLVNVTAQGCTFLNLSAFFGFDGSLTPPAASVCWAEAGGRNYYSNVQFFGGGDALTAAVAGMRSLTIGGNGENLFENCTIGLDTVQRITNANASLEIVSGSARNRIRGSLFEAWNGLAGNSHILIASGGMDRYLILDKGCILHNFGTAMSAAVLNAGGSPGGDVVIAPDTISVGATALATTGQVYVGQIGTNAPTTTGIGILAT